MAAQVAVSLAKSLARLSISGGGRPWARAVRRRHELLEAVAGLAEEVVLRDLQVGERQACRVGAAQAELVLVAVLAEALPRRFDREQRDPPVAGGGVGLGRDDGGAGV